MLHPLLLGLYLVLSLLAGNLGEVHLEEAWRALIALPLAVGLLLVVARLVVGSLHAAGVLVSVALVLAWTHGTLLEVALDLVSDAIAEEVFWIVLVVEVVLLAGCTALVSRQREATRTLAPVLNVVADVLFALPLLEIALYSARGGAILSASRPHEEDDLPLIALKPGTETPRDIYYVVLDGYTRSDVLRAFYGGDNSAFIDSLRERAFFVAAKSRSNYLSTKLALPSVLNLDYLDAIAERVGRRSKDTGPLLRRIRHNRVVSALSAIGYRIVNITSGIPYVALAEPNEAISLAHAGLRVNEFESALLRMTPLPELLDRILPARSASPAALHRRRVEYAIEQLASQGGAPGPKFVFAHIASPHDPFVFGPSGGPRAIYLQLFRNYGARQAQFLARAYAAQVHHLNGLVLEAIDRILADSQRPPIIVVQGDHGLRLFLKRQAEDSCLQESFAILNVLHLPEAGSEFLYDTISPVNTFRTIFDAYFGTDLGRLDDRTYFAHRYGYYDFQDVTERAETCTTMSDLPIRDGL